MSRDSKERKPQDTAKVGPVKRGTSLYRVLEMIAHEIAKGLDTGASSGNRRQRTRCP
jgi:hypothetical protein